MKEKKWNAEAPQRNGLCHQGYVIVNGK